MVVRRAGVSRNIWSIVTSFHITNMFLYEFRKIFWFLRFNTKDKTHKGFDIQRYIADLDWARI